MGMESLNVSRRIGLLNLDLPYKSAIETVVDSLKYMPLFDTLVRLSSINLVLSNERRIEDVEPHLRKVHVVFQIIIDEASFFDFISYRHSSSFL